MFILINNIPYNSFSIASFARQTRVNTDNYGNDSFVYAIVFELNNGTVLVEDYSTEEERNAAYNSLLSRLLGYEEPVETLPTNQTGEEVTQEDNIEQTSEEEQENETPEDTSENIE